MITNSRGNLVEITEVIWWMACTAPFLEFTADDSAIEHNVCSPPQAEPSCLRFAHGFWVASCFWVMRNISLHMNWAILHCYAL